MAVKYELMAPVGSYEIGGEKKTRWLKCGAIFAGDNGPKIKIDCTPTSVIDRDGNSVAWNGWLNAETTAGAATSQRQSSRMHVRMQRKFSETTMMYANAATTATSNAWTRYEPQRIFR